MSYLQVENLSKTFDGNDAPVIAIGDVSFAVERGAFVSILGPSGCGKTTLLRTIAGLEKPSSGQIVLDGKPVMEPGPQLGVVFQEHRLFPWLTVRDNVEYGLARQGVPKKQRKEISDHYLNMVGLAEFANQFPKALSIGMSQRVGIARALASDPDVLLMDEPFASVDAQTRRELHDELLNIWHQTNKTILFITHSVDEAVLLSQRVLVLSSRPSRVIKRFQIDSDYPRQETDLEFNEIRRQVLDVLYSTKASAS